MAAGVGMAAETLAEQRRILVSGPLDHEAVTGLSAQLMAFDGMSSRAVELIVNSPGGPLADVFPLFDVLHLMRATVNATVIGSVKGTAVGLVAACTGQRGAAAHATFSLRLDAIEATPQTAADIIEHAEQLRQLRSRYVAVLSVATGQNEDALSPELERGRALTADEARDLGIVDTVADRSTT